MRYVDEYYTQYAIPSMISKGAAPGRDFVGVDADVCQATSAMARVKHIICKDAVQFSQRPRCHKQYRT